MFNCWNPRLRSPWFKASEEVKAEILKFAQDNLAKYKVPKFIEFLDQLPLTTIGKVDKKALRKM
ncbi:MAG: AMP-binding enzyme [Promethearchaeota archaeon]